uniref:protein At5g25060 n=1 Tax=Arabidopsis thaliana TaxID=3702 RepID=UPI000156182C|nr:Chain A, protein At5g25060 [Arabidopsis thaliana]
GSSGSSGNGMDEEQRQKRRRIEVALIEYRETLEEQGMKNPEEIERKVEINRKRLEVDYGLS